MDNIVTNLVDMCKDRNYENINVDDNSCCEHSEEFKLLISAQTKEGTNIFAFRIRKIGINVIRELLTNEELTGCHLILIYDKDITSFSKKHLKLCTKFTYELHCSTYFRINPTRHELVPDHTKLDETEKENIVNKFGSTDNLPKILKTDPISKWYSFCPGDIIRIKRPTPTGVYMEVYRMVV